MRLLTRYASGALAFTDGWIGADIPKYAILSHTWGREIDEVTYNDILKGSGLGKAGYAKIEFCMKRSKEDGLEHIWIDTCCIDKTNHAELTEAINSMFRWYANSERCYAYLTDVQRSSLLDESWMSSFRTSRWFRRGWTLQELLAPVSVEFFDRAGVSLGTKQSLQTQINAITGIPTQALEGLRMNNFTVDERMSWLEGRETKKAEDSAYCLLGIFGVYMPLIYGEGREHAFQRLHKELAIKQSVKRTAPQPSSAIPLGQESPCVRSLCPSDQSHFVSQLLARSKGACSWVFGRQEYANWFERSTSPLPWISAGAGCGKTTVTAHVCDKLMNIHANRRYLGQNVDHKFVLLRFFFQRSNNKAVTTALAAFRTLAFQLLQQHDSVLPILKSRYDLLSAKGDFDWSWETLASVFREMLTKTFQRAPVFVVLDALDECESKSRSLLLEWIDAMVLMSSSSGQQLKVLVTSRPDGEMNDVLSGFAPLAVTNADTMDDMRSLIRHRVETLGRQRRLQSTVRRDIVRFLEQNAEGMFLWVVLKFKELELRDVRLTDDVIASKLSSMPLTLIGTYHAVLRNTLPSRRQDMLRILRWVLHGSRSLTLQELEAGLCFETNTTRWHDFEGDLRFLCGSFLHWDEQGGGVVFIHQTARDFLKMYSHNMVDISDHGPSLGGNESNERLASVCIQYFIRDSLITQAYQQVSDYKANQDRREVLDDFLSRHQLLGYALQSWAFHLRNIDAPSDQIVVITKALIDSAQYRRCIRFVDEFFTRGTVRNLRYESTPLHFAALFGLAWLVAVYILENPQSVHATNNIGHTPLHWAIFGGDLECVRKLLHAGADSNHREANGWSALHFACHKGHLGIAKLLLESGASTLHKDAKRLRPSHIARELKRLDIAILIDTWSAQESCS